MGNANKGSAQNSGYSEENIKRTAITKKVLTARKSVCKVVAPHKGNGIGALYEVIDTNGISLFLLMTCNHVLPTNSLFDIAQTIFEFEDIEQMKLLALSREHVKNIWISILLDATVIEISSELATMFKSYGAIFLKVGNVEPNVEVAVIQYPDGKFSIAHGDTDEIIGHDVYYHIVTSDGSSGSPLLDRNCVALAMHRQGDTDSACDKRKVRTIIAIVDAYLVERQNVGVVYANEAHRFLDRQETTISSANSPRALSSRYVRKYGPSVAGRLSHIHHSRFSCTHKRKTIPNASMTYCVSIAHCMPKSFRLFPWAKLGLKNWEG